MYTLHRPTSSRRRPILPLMALVVTLAAAACSSDPESSATLPTQEVGDTTADAATGTTVPGETTGSVAPGLPEASGDATAATDGAGGTTGETLLDEDGVPVAADAAGLEGPELEEYLARRYEAFWDAYDAARGAPTASPQTDFPALGDLAAGEMLEASYEELIRMATDGEALREPETPAVEGIEANAEHRIRVDLVDGTVAELSGCLVNDDVRHIPETGDIVQDSVITVQSVATMALNDGQWKVIRSRSQDITDGVSGCWLEDASAFPW